MSLIFAVFLICYVVKLKRKHTYLPIETISKDNKHSPQPHKPTVIKKSNQRTRVFSGSKSKSRSRSNNNKKEIIDSLRGCVDNSSEEGYMNLNSTNGYVCCSNDGIDNLAHDGVMLDLEDCCQMTICDTVR